jgi:hypothetical protein
MAALAVAVDSASTSLPRQTVVQAALTAVVAVVVAQAPRQARSELAARATPWSNGWTPSQFQPLYKTCCSPGRRRKPNPEL